MIRQGKEIRANSTAWDMDAVGVWLIDHDRDGNRMIAKPLEFEPFIQGSGLQPTLHLLPESAQVLIDDLWSAGFRPTQGRQSEGVTAAQAEHLADMRAIVADRLKVALP